MYERVEVKSWRRDLDGTGGGADAAAIAKRAARDDTTRRFEPEAAPAEGAGAGKPAVLEYEAVLDEAA